MELSKQMLEHAYTGGFIDCKHMHEHSCNYNAWLKFLTVFRSSVKFYIPIHLVPLLLFKRKRLLT